MRIATIDTRALALFKIGSIMFFVDGMTGRQKAKDTMTTSKTLYAASFSGGRATISLDADGEYEVMFATVDGTDYEYHTTERLALKSCASVGIKMHRIGSPEEAVKAAVADGWKVAS